MRPVVIAVVVAAVAVAAGAFAVTRGDDAPSEQVRALKADPIATYKPPGGRLVSTSERNERAGGGFSKQQEARYVRVFSLPGAGGRSALDDAAAAARAAGWSVSEAIPGAGVTATKQLPSGRATLSISLAQDAAQLPSGVDPPALTITLRHARA